MGRECIAAAESGGSEEAGRACLSFELGRVEAGEVKYVAPLLVFLVV